MKKISKLQWCIWVLAVAPLAATALLYGRLPKQVPLHWGLDGSINYGHKAQLFIISGMAPLFAALFIVIGNMMPKFRQNFFCGIKTPWALSNEKVWNKTHRLGGRLMFAAGILGIASICLPSAAAFTVVIGSVLLTVAVPSVMSYFWYQRDNKG